MTYHNHNYHYYDSVSRNGNYSYIQVGKIPMENVTVHMVSNRNSKSRLLSVIDGWKDENNR